MNKRHILGLILSLSAFVMVLLGSNNIVNAQYKGNNETPTELRGTWYCWYKDADSFEKIQVFKHTVYIDGKLSYSLHPKNKSISKLHVTRQKMGGYVYYFNPKSGGSYYWLSKDKIHGKRVLKSTGNDALLVSVMQKGKKIHHDYNYYLGNKVKNGDIKKINSLIGV